jgi:two-component system sensor histidine kinase RegB
MGLGIFIAETLLGRTGGNVSFANREGGGAEVAVRWNRVILEARDQLDAA